MNKEDREKMLQEMASVFGWANTFCKPLFNCQDELPATAQTPEEADKILDRVGSIPAQDKVT